MQNRIGTALRKFGLGSMSIGEYQANLSGMNTFFGAVLGFVLTGTEKLNSWQFGTVLMMLAGTVISILFISNSRHRVAYAIYTLVLALIFPELIDFLFNGHDLVPDKVRPTLIVWTLLTILVEFWGSESGDRSQA